MAKKPIKCKVRILCPLSEVYHKYQPKVGEVYEAYYKNAQIRSDGNVYNPVCFIEVLDKKICLRKGEYEILEGRK